MLHGSGADLGHVSEAAVVCVLLSAGCSRQFMLSRTSVCLLVYGWLCSLSCQARSLGARGKYLVIALSSESAVFRPLPVKSHNYVCLQM